MKISHKFKKIDGSEGTRSNSEDFGTVGSRFLKRIADIVGEDNEKKSKELFNCLNSYNKADYEVANSSFSKIIKDNPSIAEELEPFQEICSRVLSCKKNNVDYLYEKCLEDIKNWDSQSFIHKLLNRNKNPYLETKLKIRCKYCGHYTSFINPNTGMAYMNSNNCGVCGRGYPAPSVYWDNIDGQAYIYYRGSVSEDVFYDEFERKHDVYPGRDYFMNK